MFLPYREEGVYPSSKDAKAVNYQNFQLSIFIKRM